MSVGDFPKDLKGIVDAGLDWFDACRHPAAHCDALLSISSDQDKINKSLQLWIVISFIGLILQLPLLKIAGIEWETIGYHLPNFLILTSIVLLTGFILHLGLRIYGIISSLADIIAIYTTFVGVYSPILILMSYPSTAPVFGALKTAKAQGMPFLSAMVFMLKNQIAIGKGGYLSVVIATLFVPIFVASLSFLTFMGYKVAAIYSVPRSKVLSSFAFSLSILLTPLIIGQVFLSYFILYTFTKA